MIDYSSSICNQNITDEYLSYINSEEWKRKREKRLAIDDHTCQICKRKNVPLDVHHKTYLNFGNENVCSDLITLCYDCHNMVTANKKSEKDFEYKLRKEYLDLINQKNNKPKRIAKDFCRLYDHRDFYKKGNLNLCDLKIIKRELEKYYEILGEPFDEHNCKPNTVQTYFRNQRYRLILSLRRQGADDNYIASQYKFSYNFLSKPDKTIYYILSQEEED